MGLDATTASMVYEGVNAAYGSCSKKIGASGPALDHAFRG